MLIKKLYANLLDNPLPDVVYLQCHDEKRGRRIGRDVSTKGGLRGHIMLHCCPKEYVNIIFYYLYFSIL